MSLAFLSFINNKIQVVKPITLYLIWSSDYIMNHEVLKRTSVNPSRFEEREET